MRHDGVRKRVWGSAARFHPVAPRRRKRVFCPCAFEPPRWCYSSAPAFRRSPRADDASSAFGASRLVPLLAGVMHIECWHILCAPVPSGWGLVCLSLGLRHPATPTRPASQSGLNGSSMAGRVAGSDWRRLAPGNTPAQRASRRASSGPRAGQVCSLFDRSARGAHPPHPRFSLRALALELRRCARPPRQRLCLTPGLLGLNH